MLNIVNVWVSEMMFIPNQTRQKTTRQTREARRAKYS
jgi:hypothetical protein